MATETSSIDELLSGVGTYSQPDSPESSYEETNEPEDVVHEEPEEQDSQELNETQEDEEVEEERLEKKKPEQEYDEYGNAKSGPKTYSEEEVNEKISRAVRDRLARIKQDTPQQPAQQPSGFEYNPESAETWEAQLEKFVEQTVSKMGQRETQKQIAQREHQADEQFRDKFTQGMDRFGDFRQVVETQPVTDSMTMALRGMNDPAAFIYAASKRHGTELQRISQLADPYAQIVEMGKLEERMRKAAPLTRAPKPVSRSTDDAGLPNKSKSKEPSIEELIAKSESKKRAQIAARKK